jgi:hypothetical protein
MSQTTILTGLFIRHWLADYTHLSTDWMLKAKSVGKPLSPILAHAFVHAVLALIFLILFIGFKERVLWISVFELITHFLIDVFKGKMNVWTPSVKDPANRWHWVIFGFDQLLHSLVIVMISDYITGS